MLLLIQNSLVQKFLYQVVQLQYQKMQTYQLKIYFQLPFQYNTQDLQTFLHFHQLPYILQQELLLHIQLPFQKMQQPTSKIRPLVLLLLQLLLPQQYFLFLQQLIMLYIMLQNLIPLPLLHYRFYHHHLKIDT